MSMIEGYVAKMARRAGAHSGAYDCILYTFPCCLTGCLFFSFIFVLVPCSGVSCNISLYILSLRILLRDFLVSGARILNELEILAAFGTSKG